MNLLILTKETLLAIGGPFKIHFLVIQLNEFLNLPQFTFIQCADILYNRITILLDEQFGRRFFC